MSVEKLDRSTKPTDSTWRDPDGVVPMWVAEACAHSGDALVVYYDGSVIEVGGDGGVGPRGERRHSVFWCKRSGNPYDPMHSSNVDGFYRFEHYAALNHRYVDIQLQKADHWLTDNGRRKHAEWREFLRRRATPPSPP